jgi:hypothetical protein
VCPELMMNKQDKMAENMKDGFVTKSFFRLTENR